MITDKIENLNLYLETVRYAKEIQEFVKKAEEEKLPDGIYELKGDDLFVSIQSYETSGKDGKYMEAHKLYADLQYMISGEELNLWDYTDELKLKEDRTPAADILFFENRTDFRRVLLVPGTFAFYMANDAHMPGIAVADPIKCRKIVFKIKMKSAG